MQLIVIIIGMTVIVIIVCKIDYDYSNYQILFVMIIN